MDNIRGEFLQDKILLHLSGRIDSGNVGQTENSIREFIGEESTAAVDIDAENLTYISSAGLRMILRLRKNHPEMRILNVNSEIYEILDMTGFTQMMKVEKAWQQISIEGAEELGRGANGIVYRISGDLVVKVFYNPDSLEEIQRERELARKALVLGIPTAISYDVVRVGDSYGSVYELLNAQSFSNILEDEPEKMDWCIGEYVDLLKLIHGISVPKGELPDARETALDWAVFLKDYLPAETWRKLSTLFDSIPESNTMLHGDYHTNNVELVGDEVLLIDMDTLSVGHPILELGSIFNAFQGFSEYDHSIIQKFQGFDWQTASTFWKKFLAAYLGTDDEAKIREVEDKAKIVGYTRIIRRSIRRNGLETEAGRAEIELWKAHLMEALDRVDTLDFSCFELKIEADQKNLPTVTAFIEKLLDGSDCSGKTRMQILIAVEEIFVNIIHYAYRPGTGFALIRADISNSPAALTVSFTDSGKPFDPLARPDPDVTLSAEEREIGGLGIFMARKLMDNISYEYREGKNVLTMSKVLP